MSACCAWSLDPLAPFLGPLPQGKAEELGGFGFHLNALEFPETFFIPQKEGGRLLVRKFLSLKGERLGWGYFWFIQNVLNSPAEWR